MTIPVRVDDAVAFGCPEIAPKHYIVNGPSGWPETFDRKSLDSELKRYLNPVPPSELAGVFIAQRELQIKPEPPNWHTVVGFLARTLGVSPRAVPPTVGIAFWATIELCKQERAAN